MAIRRTANHHIDFKSRAAGTSSDRDDGGGFSVNLSTQPRPTERLVVNSKNNVSQILLSEIENMLDVSFKQSEDFGIQDNGVLFVRKFGPVLNYLKRYGKRNIPVNELIRYFIDQYKIPQDVSDGYIIYRSGELLLGKGEDFVDNILSKFRNGEDIRMITRANRWDTQKARKLFLFLVYKTYGAEEYRRVLLLPNTEKLITPMKRKK